MAFAKYDENNKLIRNKVVCDCSNDKPITEQNHKGSVDINEIVRKTAGGFDRIAATANITALSYDTNPYNDFEEMMTLVAKGKQAFESLPHEVREEFNNNPAKYMDYVRNPENKDDLVKRGWVEPPPKEPAPAQVQMMVQSEDGGLVPALAPNTETPA